MNKGRHYFIMQEKSLGSLRTIFLEVT